MSVNTKVNGQLVKSAGLYSVSTPIGMADIYSTEEKEVGLWIDNKPLYAKTIHFGALPNNTTKTVAHNISNLSYIVNIVATAKNSSGAHVPLPQTSVTSAGAQFAVSADLSDIYISTGQDRSSLDAYVTIFYTKTTDTPWSGKFVPQGYGYVSSGDIYSFEERQVGVWADGKPLYQKTFRLSNVTLSSGSNTVVSTSQLSSLSIDKVIGDVSGSLTFNSGANVIDIPFAIGATSYITAYYDNSTGIVMLRGGNALATTDIYLTIQYTKTTDVAGSGEYVPSGDKAVHYDDTEQVIGTWFGETLYRKSLKLPSTITCANSSWTDTGLTIQNIDRVISGEVLRNGTQSFALSVNNDNNAIKVQSYYNSTLTLDSNTYITLEYTKTS